MPPVLSAAEPVRKSGLLETVEASSHQGGATISLVNELYLEMPGSEQQNPPPGSSAASEMPSSLPTPVSNGIAAEIRPTLQLDPTFRVMEKRRSKRSLKGRVTTQGLWRYTSETSKMVIVAMFLVHLFKVPGSDWIVEYREVPAIVTAVLFIITGVRTWQMPEHVFTEWVKLEGNVFVLWLAWEYDREEHERLNCWWTKPCVLPNEGHVMHVFAYVLAATFAVAIFRYLILPRAVLSEAFWKKGASFWWRIRDPTDGIAGEISTTFADFSNQIGIDTFRSRDFAKKTSSRNEVKKTYTYSPSGWCTLRRSQFGYCGEVDEDGRPQGKGMWFDNSFHGECLQGYWEGGRPVGTFTSREHGTGAQFAQRSVAYATSRKDCQPPNLAKSSWMPCKDDVLRYGVAQVEVSVAGGFFPFLPRIDDHCHDVCKDIGDVKRRFMGAHDRSNLRLRPPPDRPPVSESLRPHLELTVLEEDELTGMLEQSEGAMQQAAVPIWYGVGDRSAFIKDADLLGPARRLIEKSQEDIPLKATGLEKVCDVCGEVFMDDSVYCRKCGTQRPAEKEAFVFLHGFNADLATILGRIAQLFSLGGMAPHIVPFLFSYSGGFELTYLEVKKHMKDYGEDLKTFFTSLGEEFSEVHILCHSCGAEFFFENVDDFIDCFEERRPTSPKSSSTSSSTPKKPHLATLTLVNPDVLVDTVNEKLPKVMKVAEHFTTYNDKQDGALFWSNFVRRFIPGRMQKGTVQPKDGRHPVIFGSVVSPLWLEDTEDNITMKLRGPMMELPASRGCLWGCGGKGGSEEESSRPHCPDPRIDVIDCSTVDQNIHKLRHNYYMLNTQVVEDICELIGRRKWAIDRSRLQIVEANVFNFLCPPASLIDL